MRQLSANVAPLIDNDDLETLYLVRVTSRDGSVLYASTTWHDTVTLSNGSIYVSDGKLVSADPPQLSTTVDREQYSITTADPDFVDGKLAEAGLTGKIMEVRLGFVNPETGLPFTHVNDTFVLYRGKVDGAAYKVDTAEYGEVLLQITGVSPILSLDMKKGIYLSRDAVRQRNVNDTCCDQIYQGSSAIVLKWGRG